MLAFITCNSNLVPLLEGLCSSNPCRLRAAFRSVHSKQDDPLGGPKNLSRSALADQIAVWTRQFRDMVGAQVFF